MSYVIQFDIPDRGTFYEAEDPLKMTRDIDDAGVYPNAVAARRRVLSYRDAQLVFGVTTTKVKI